MSLRCFYCDAGLEPGTFFCPECGRRVSDTGVAPAVSGFAVDPIAFAPAPTEAQLDVTMGDIDETASLQLTQPASRPFVLIASTGQRFEVRGRSLIGRNPTPVAGQAYEAVLVLVDDGKTVSKNHAELLVVADQLLVIDLDSGNGTVIENPGEAPVRVTPGLPHPALRGSRMQLGRQSVSVE